jgi:hypothetical protein
LPPNGSSNASPKVAPRSRTRSVPSIGVKHSTRPRSATSSAPCARSPRPTGARSSNR